MLVTGEVWREDPFYATILKPRAISSTDNKADEEFTVIEGNRRLAAVKGLLKKEFASKRGIERNSSQTELGGLMPVLVVSDDKSTTIRREVDELIAFKHINSSKRWGNYAKAGYIHTLVGEVRDELPKENTSDEEIFRSISMRVGDTENAVPQLYEAFALLKQAREAKEEFRFGIERRANCRNRLPFDTWLFTLQELAVRAYLGLKHEVTLAGGVPESKLPRLKQLCEWVFGNHQTGADPVILDFDDMEMLNDVLMDDESANELLEGRALSDVWERMSDASSRATDRLKEAEHALHEANTLLEQVVPNKKLQQAELKKRLERIKDLQVKLTDQARTRKTTAKK
jgi:hypothetical protein